MLLRYAKAILAGIAVSAISGFSLVIGTVFGSLITAVARNPGLTNQLFSYATLIFAALTPQIDFELGYVEVLVNMFEVQYLSLYATGRSLAPIEEVIASSSLSPTAAVKVASTTSGDAPVNPWAAANQVVQPQAVQPAQQQAIVQQGPQGGGPNNPRGPLGGSIFRSILFNLMLKLLRIVDSYSDAAAIVAGGTAVSLSNLSESSTVSSSDTVSLQQAFKACSDDNKQLKADLLTSLSEKAQLQVDLALALAQNEQLQSVILTQANVIAILLLFTLIFGPLFYYGGWVLYYKSIAKLKESFNRDASLS